MPDQLWPGRPRPLQDETFSSWFARVAIANGLLPQELFRAALPGAHLHSRDLDRLACPQLIATMAENTGIELDRVHDLTLRTWLGRLIEEDTGLNKLLWLAPVGRDAARKSFGQQICPLCLDDETPYLRKTWRLGFVTICQIHSVSLVDRCGGCGMPVAPNTSWDERGRPRCRRCGQCFRRMPAEPLEWEQDLLIQNGLLDAAESGWMCLGVEGPIHSLAAFRLLMIVFRVLATGRYSLSLRGWLAERAPLPASPPANIPRVKEVEHLNPRCRRELLRQVHYLLEDWPARFIEACRGVGASSSDLLHGRPVPFVYWHAVTFNLSEPVRVLDLAEAEEAASVLRRQGLKSHYRELVSLTGTKLAPRRGVVEPQGRRPYGEGRYWKLDGISPEIRVAVKQAAGREGENVAGWVERALRAALDEGRSSMS